MQLRRGQILLIAGGTMVIISISMLGFYGLQFVNSIQQDEKFNVNPGSSLEIKQSINASQGAYVVAFPDFDGQLSVIVRDPAGRVIVDKSVEPPIVIEPFEAKELGVYTLTLFNPTEKLLETTVILGDQETVLGRSSLSSATTALSFTLLLGAGIAVAIAGVVITVLDRRRISKMKQYGDTSDLV